MARIFIKGNVPSLKNSKIKTDHGIFSSKTVVKYLRGLGIKSYSASKKTIETYKKYPYVFGPIVEPMKKHLLSLDPPYVVGLYFVRNSERHFDWINSAQIVLDLLVAADVISDDDMDNIIPSPYNINGLWYHVDKDNPGVLIDY